MAVFATNILPTKFCNGNEAVKTKLYHAARADKTFNAPDVFCAMSGSVPHPLPA